MASDPHIRKVECRLLAISGSETHVASTASLPPFSDIVVRRYAPSIAPFHHLATPGSSLKRFDARAAGYPRVEDVVAASMHPCESLSGSHPGS